MRNNQFVTLTDGRRIQVSALAGDLKNQKPRTWPNINLDGVPCALSLKRLSGKDLLAVVSFGLQPSADPLETYRQRWAIELCFACLKTKGFDIESTHLRASDRLEKMFAIASMAAAAALATSQNENKKQIGVRKHPLRKKPWLRRPFRLPPRLEFAPAVFVHLHSKYPFTSRPYGVG